MNKRFLASEKVSHSLGNLYLIGLTTLSLFSLCIPVKATSLTCNPKESFCQSKISDLPTNPTFEQINFSGELSKSSQLLVSDLPQGNVSNTGAKSVKYILGGLLGLTLLSVLFGIIYQAIGTKRDKTKYLPPGKLVEVKGRQFHLHCTGEGSITVVMDYGIGGLSLVWSLVQPEVAKFARVCSYDRAGYGWSESSQNPRTSQQMVEELRALLDEAGIEGPYVLVGHSLGGLNARLFASKYPEKVIGMVLVDAVPAEVYSRLTPAWQEGMTGLRKKFSSLVWIARLGLLRLSLQLKGAAAAPDFIQKLPLEVQPKILSQFLPKTFATAIAENELMQSSAEQVCQVELAKDLPLAVLSHGVNMFADLSVREPEQAELIWQELQKSMANLSSDSTFEIVESSGHDIHIYQPQVVVEAIHQVVEKCCSREHQSGS